MSFRVRLMFGRCLSILLIGAYVACQASALPHAHRDGQVPHKRGERHVHLYETCHCHAAHDGHHHDHDPHSCDHSLTAPAGSSSDHDSDAIYVPDVVLLRSDVSNDGIDYARGFAAEAAVAMSTVDAASELAAGFQKPNGICASVRHCALYLELRTLRI